uniref:Coiled-coil-helix-coiled-coil-helix domain containing 1 n=1 Tax=Mus musculus TaxID=10090 RepID=A0A286YDP8_MOUSE
MATPSLRGRLARFANPGKPILKPNKPLILANRVGNRRREKGVLPLQRQPVSRRCR